MRVYLVEKRYRYEEDGVDGDLIEWEETRGQYAYLDKAEANKCANALVERYKHDDDWSVNLHAIDVIQNEFREEQIL